MDSFPSIFNVYKIMCRAVGVTCPSNIEKFRKAYGYSFIECYENLGIKEKDHLRLEKIYKREIVKQKTKLFAGIAPVIKKLSQDYILILATANYEVEIKEKLQRHKLLKYFSHVVAKKSIKEKYRKSVGAIRLLKKLKIKKSEVISIGDRDIDYDIAKKLEIKNILIVEYGWGHTNKVKNQKTIIRQPKDILNAIKKIV